MYFDVATALAGCRRGERSVQPSPPNGKTAVRAVEAPTSIAPDTQYFTCQTVRGCSHVTYRHPDATTAKLGSYMSFNAWTLMLGVIGLLLNSVGLAFVATQIALARAQAARARDSEVQNWRSAGRSPLFRSWFLQRSRSDQFGVNCQMTSTKMPSQPSSRKSQAEREIGSAK
jgi:hypothetical protein